MQMLYSYYSILIINKSKKQTTSFYIKPLAQALAGSKEQRYNQSLIKHLRSSSGDLARLPDLCVEFIWFLSLIIKKRFSGFNLCDMQHFKWSIILK